MTAAGGRKGVIHLYNIIYPNLRAECGRHALTVAGMAQELNMTRSRLRRMLSGATEMTIDVAKEIRRRYFPDKSLDELFGEKD